MKHKITVIGCLILSALLFGACGMTGGGDSLTVKTKDGINETVDLKAGKFLVRKGSRTSSEVTEFLICVTNKEDSFPADTKSYQLQDKAKEGEVKVCFEINGQEGFNEDAQIAAGTYQMADFAGGYKPDRVGLSPKIYTFKDGKANKEFLKSNGTKGEVEITSASADNISGNINLSDGDNEIKGSFSAERLKKS
jgi:hypothetical protein